MRPLFLALLFSSVALVQAETPAPVEVMILGTFHLGNPGQDLHNVKAEDVLTPAKQLELADLAKRLTAFQPTKIMVEGTSSRPDLVWPKFEGFSPAQLTQNPDERIQIACRLARQLQQKQIYGIDEQSDAIDYFPFDKVIDFAAKHGLESKLAAMQEEVETEVRSISDAQKTKSISAILADINEPAKIERDQREFYDALIPFATGTDQSGADLNAAWFHRNVRIFAKLTSVAQPGDRVLVVFGSGHAYWLRHFASHTPGFKLAEPEPLLR